MSRFPPAAAAFVLLSLGACHKPAASAVAGGMPTLALNDAIEAGLGGPGTCVVLADAAGGDIRYQYGRPSVCMRRLPACGVLPAGPDGISTREALAALKSAPAAQLAPASDDPHLAARTASCDTAPGGARTVGWAIGRFDAAKGPVLFAASMEGEDGLPGMELKARLVDALRRTGVLPQQP